MGFGLFNVEEFLMSQQCCWIYCTAVKSCRYNWHNDIYELSFGNPLALSPKIIDAFRPERVDDDNAKTMFSEFCLLKRPGRKCRLLLSKGRNGDLS